jgi:hypothetical protein
MLKGLRVDSEASVEHVCDLEEKRQGKKDEENHNGYARLRREQARPKPSSAN